MAEIPIGQFSQMTRLSVKALRLYDGNGLLPAARVDPASGYRYYEPAQANVAEAIRVLRSVDMPLDEIKAVLAADTPEAVHKQLAVHRERLAERLAADERMLNYLEALIERGGGVMPYTVQVDEVAPQLVAATRFRTDLNRIGGDIGAGFGRLVQVLGGEGSQPIGSPFVVYHDVIDEETDGDVEICIPISGAITGNGDVASREFDGGTVAFTVHHGPYQEVGPAYHTLTAWIAEHEHEVTGPPREVYVNDPQSVPPEDLVTRVEFPVRPAGSGSS